MGSRSGPRTISPISRYCHKLADIWNWLWWSIDWHWNWQNVVVPESQGQLTDHQLQELQNRIDPLSDDGNNGINHFWTLWRSWKVSLTTMKNNVLNSNQKYCQASCDGNGSSRTYDHCYLSHELHKDEKSFSRCWFHQKQCIMNINQSIRLNLCCCVQSLCNEMFINIIYVSVVWKWLHWTLSEEQNLCVSWFVWTRHACNDGCQ